MRPLVVLLAALLAALGLNIHQAGGVDEFLYSLFPYISSVHFQFVGAWYVRVYTCWLLPLARAANLVAPALACQGVGAAAANSDLLVVVTAAKGGTVLAARASIDIAVACGLCGAIGYRPHGKWPPAQESMPSYRGDVLLAIANAQTWPAYAREHGGAVRCAVFTRDPVTRFQSLFQYVMDGSEYDLRAPAAQLRALLPDYAGALAWMFEEIGRETMVESHKVLLLSLARPDCRQIKFEDFAHDFDRAALQWAEAWGIDARVAGRVVASLHRHDVKRKSAADLAKEHHLSGTKLSAADRRSIEEALEAHEELRALLARQRKELGYA